MLIADGGLLFIGLLLMMVGIFLYFVMWGAIVMIVGIIGAAIAEAFGGDKKKN